MEAVETLNKVKEFFNSLIAPAPVAPAVAPQVAPVAPVALGTDYKLADGTAVMIDKLEPGGVVMINDAPAPAGEHILEDGTKIEVVEGGVIAEVYPATPVAPAAPVEAPMAQAPVIPSPSLAQFEAMVQEFADYKEKTKEMFSKVIEAMDELAKQPTAKPDPVVAPSKQKFTQTENIAEKLSDFSKSLFSTQKK